MNKLIILFFALTLCCGELYAKNDVPDYDYELETAWDFTSANVDFVVFKIWSFAKKRDLVTQEIGLRNAIHGLLFKGLAGDEIGHGNVPALVPEGYDYHKEYFDVFFGRGEYKQFVQHTNRGAQQAGDVIKISNKRYKVGLLVQVNKTALRKKLEQDGVIESVRSVFSK